MTNASIIATVNQKYGEGTLVDGSSEPQRMKAYPTGYPELDEAIGIGGVPRGRIVEVSGGASAGKTTLVLRMAAVTQATGGVVAYVDLDHTFDPTRARALGVDMTQLLISQPENAEVAFGVIETLARSDAVGLILVDGYQHLLTQAEIDGVAESFAGLTARLTSQTVRKLTSILSSRRTVVVFVSTTRQPCTGPVIRNALKFYASVRLDLCRIPDSTRTRVRVVKNKVAVPFREAEIEVVAPVVAL